MAGIGFELRRMIDEREGFVNKVRAYACAGLISSGPWLMTILTLTLLNIAGPALGGKTGYSLFRALVTYSFAFSLVLQGIVQMAVTRRIADLLYGHRYDRVLPAFATMLAVIGFSHAGIALGFSWYADFDPTMTALTMSLFAIIGMTWMALIWLSVVRQYDDVLRAYIYGTLISLLGIPLLFLGQGTSGILAAYTAGQAYTLVLLVRTIVRGMETGGGRDWTVVTSVVSFPLLVGVGFLYNAAIWADKMIFWFADGKNPHPLVYYHPLYDTCSFLAYLTVVPALAVNLIRLETSFYEKYRAYYGAILGGTPLSVIEDKKERMFTTLRESIVRLLRVQGAISIAVILFAPLIIDFLELPPIAVRIFRLTCLGAYFHVLLLITILMQMYFDLQRQAFATSLLFCVLNAGLAWWSVERGVETYGIGYSMASFLGLLLGYMLLHGSLERLDYLSFTNQPIAEKEEQLAAATTEEEEQESEDEQDEEAEEPEEPEEPEPVEEVDTETVDVPAPFEAVDEVETATVPGPSGLDEVAREIVDDDGDYGEPATATEFDHFFEEAGDTADAPTESAPEPFADDEVETLTRTADAAPDHDSFVPAFALPAEETATETEKNSGLPPTDETQADGALSLEPSPPDSREGKDAEDGEASAGEPDGTA